MNRLVKSVPVILTCLLIAWTLAVYRYSQYDDAWAIDPALLVFPVALLWHIALIVVEKPRYLFVWYAIIHLPILLIIWFGCLMAISKDSI